MHVINSYKLSLKYKKATKPFSFFRVACEYSGLDYRFRPLWNGQWPKTVNGQKRSMAKIGQWQKMLRYSKSKILQLIKQRKGKQIQATRENKITYKKSARLYSEI